MNKIEKLVEAYEEHAALPWATHAADPEKTWFIVYDPQDERRLRCQLLAFATATRDAGHEWQQFDLTGVFPEWMAADKYSEAYFEDPETVEALLSDDLPEFIASRVREVAESPACDSNTVLAIYGTSSLFGLTPVAALIAKILPSVAGRLAVFFPGSYDDSVYRHLDATEGWDYLATPITVKEG